MYTISKYTSIVHLSNEKGQTHISGMKAEELLNTFFFVGAVRPLWNIKGKGRLILQPIPILFLKSLSLCHKKTLKNIFA